MLGPAETEVHMSEEGLQLLITLDDPWNIQECDTFNNRQAEHTANGQPNPTRGRHDRRAEEIPDDDAYKVTFGKGDRA